MNNRVISYIESSFWACRASEFDSLCRIAYREPDRLDAILSAQNFDDEGNVSKFDSMLAKPGERLNGTRYVSIRENGVAIIEVSGVIAKRMSMFAEICYGGTSTETLLKDFNTALNSPNISSIVFHIDSPGGEAFGINELAQAIYDARGKKPMKAYVSGLGCSGAYWIASAADEIIADKSAFLGSIGVVTTWTDDSGFYKSLGIRREVITSTNAPLKRLNLDNEDHRTELMRELDSLESIFHKTVARNRKVSVEHVKKDFNRGGVLSGVDAVKAKMADRTGSLEQVVKELAKKNKQNKAFTSSAEFTGEEFDMGFKEDFKAFAVKHGLMQDSEISALEKGENPVETVSAETQKLQTEKQQADARAAAAEAELAKVKAEKLEAEAADFVKNEIQAGRMFPAEKDVFVAAYIQAANDDQSSPLTEGSRLGNLKTIQEKRTPHGLTGESLAPNTEVKILAGEPDEAAKLDAEVEAQANSYVATTQPKRHLEAVK